VALEVTSGDGDAGGMKNEVATPMKMMKSGDGGAVRGSRNHPNTHRVEALSRSNKKRTSGLEIYLYLY
jgi:hypothetical protein